MRAIPVLAFLLAIAAWSFWPAGFTEKDIASVKSSIQEEYKKSGFDVTEVTLLKEDSRKLVGFAVIGSGPSKITKSCTATMAADGKNYLWRCN